LDPAEARKDMSATKPRPLDLNATLRQVRDFVIAVDSSGCGRSDKLNRITLVKKLVEHYLFASAQDGVMGCDRPLSIGGDQFHTRFLCLHPDPLH
jgi:hypothetical protein